MRKQVLSLLVLLLGLLLLYPYFTLRREAIARIIPSKRHQPAPSHPSSKPKSGGSGPSLPLPGGKTKQLYALVFPFYNQDLEACYLDDKLEAVIRPIITSSLKGEMKVFVDANLNGEVDEDDPSCDLTFTNYECHIAPYDKGLRVSGRKFPELRSSKSPLVVLATLPITGELIRACKGKDNKVHFIYYSPLPPGKDPERKTYRLILPSTFLIKEILYRSISLPRRGPTLPLEKIMEVKFKLFLALPPGENSLTGEVKIFEVNYSSLDLVQDLTLTYGKVKTIEITDRNTLVIESDKPIFSALMIEVEAMRSLSRRTKAIALDVSPLLSTSHLSQKLYLPPKSISISRITTYNPPSIFSYKGLQLALVVGELNDGSYMTERAHLSTSWSDFSGGYKRSGFYLLYLSPRGGARGGLSFDFEAFPQLELKRSSSPPITYFSYLSFARVLKNFMMSYRHQGVSLSVYEKEFFVYPSTDLEIKIDLDNDFNPDANFRFGRGSPSNYVPISADEMEMFLGYFSSLRLELVQVRGEFLLSLRSLWVLPPDKSCKRKCKVRAKVRGGGAKY